MANYGQNFDITSIPFFNSIEGLNDIASYLDFAIEGTINKQTSNIDINTERKYATEILSNFLKGDINAFTRDKSIRVNMKQISNQKIKDIIIKNFIEKDAYNQKVRHILTPNDYIDKCAQYIAAMVRSGKKDEMTKWFDENIDAFVQEYVQTYYKMSMESRKKYEDLAYSIPYTSKALEQLNLEMKLQQLKTK